MLGLQMNVPLTITSIMRHTEALHGSREIVSVTHDNPRHRCQYSDAFRRARQLANALSRLGLKQSDRVGTMAWNDYRHFELYYAVSCAGQICHTINPRLFTEQIVYIINHAEDRCLCVDPTLVPLLEKIEDQLPTIEHYIVLSDAAHMPETSLSNVLCYEELIDAESSDFEWPNLDENTASSLCYTSGTTGNPKGVLYSHRSNVLHNYAIAMPDGIGIDCQETVLPIVPMFHANAWGLNYAVPMVGAKYVLPGPTAGDPKSVVALLEEESVTLTGAVPAVWTGILQYLRENNQTLTSLRRMMVGGSACPQSIMDELRETHGVESIHAWGMTETSPLGTSATHIPGFDQLPNDRKQILRAKQGRPVFGIELKITNDENEPLPWDGKQFGALKVRGPWVASGYFKLDESSVHQTDGWFDTGDVATIDSDGYLQITDRTKDVIKSGGEWISSIDLENVAIGHPDVVEAAVIGAPHPKWDERPLLIIVPEAGADPSREAILEYMTGKVAKWWLPDDVVFVDELPHTATGKISKLRLREQFEEYRFTSD